MDFPERPARCLQATDREGIAAYFKIRGVSERALWSFHQTSYCETPPGFINVELRQPSHLAVLNSLQIESYISKSEHTERKNQPVEINGTCLIFDDP